MNHLEQIEKLHQNRHLIAGGVYKAATVEQVAGWIQTTCELAMVAIDRIDFVRRRAVASAPLLADMPKVEFIEDDGEAT